MTGALQAWALFDSGDATQAILTLSHACGAAAAGTAERFGLEFQLFSMRALFGGATEALAGIGALRQLATQSCDAKTVASLHLAVARAETLRGGAGEARSHLYIARELARRLDSRDLQCSTCLTEATLEFHEGNLRQARIVAEQGLDIAEHYELGRQRASARANLGLILINLGEVERGVALLKTASVDGRASAFIDLAITDSLAYGHIAGGDDEAAKHDIDRCGVLIGRQTTPARSWHDLNHQITRCHYHARRAEWQEVISVVDAVESEFDRRQLRLGRTLLLASRARAEAHLGMHAEADTTIATAMHVCPPSSADPLIMLELSIGVCLALRGEQCKAELYLDRASRSCDVLRHGFYQDMVEQARASLPRIGSHVMERQDHGGASLSVTLPQVSSLLSAGHSLDLLSQRVVSVIKATSLADRLSVVHEPAMGGESEVSTCSTFNGLADFSLSLWNGTGRTVLKVSGLRDLADLEFLKSLADVLATVVNRGAEDGGSLWPLVPDAATTDGVFWSPRMQELLRVAERIASTDLPVLITGETGTGKEVFARVVHEHSSVKRGPFIPFNASAIPRELVESQLFGHRRGAFTGATDAAAGIIRHADQGTLFLDEIGDLDPAIQPKLLRFLESGEIHPLGEPRPLKVKVRVVAATNARLEGLVEQGRFRSDLFYRLRVATLMLPPLRERKDEIAALARYFTRKACSEAGRQGVTIGDDVLAAMLLYEWPGNLRQLFNEIRRMVALADDGTKLSCQHLSSEIANPWFQARETAPASTGAIDLEVNQPLDVVVAHVEKAFIERALAQTNGHVTSAAQLLGISRKGLFLKRRKLGLE